MELECKHLGNGLYEGTLGGMEFGMILTLSPDDGCYVATGYIYHTQDNGMYCPINIKASDVKPIASKVLGCDVLVDAMAKHSKGEWPTIIDHFSVIPEWWLAYRFPPKDGEYV
jgi:hypothetical protein